MSVAPALDIKAFPNRRVEDWKYSDLRAALESANDVALAPARWMIGPAPAGAEIFDLAEACKGAPDWVVGRLGKISSRDIVPAISLKSPHSGIAIHVPRNTNVATPLDIALVGAGQGRILLVLDEFSSLTVVESHAAALDGFANIGVEVVLGANARLTHIRTAGRSAGAIIVEDVAVHANRNAVYRAHYLSEGARLARLTVGVELQGEGAKAELSGASVLGDGAHADITTHVVHAVGNTQSTQTFKKVAGGKSRAVYQGRVTVREGANGADSTQSAKALLLGNRAEADLKPELEILADDVKCAHGAAIGDLDADSLFYLRARGIPEHEARAVLLRAFLEDAVAEISDEAIRALVWHAVESALPDVMAGAA